MNGDAGDLAGRLYSEAIGGLQAAFFAIPPAYVAAGIGLLAFSLEHNARLALAPLISVEMLGAALITNGLLMPILIILWARNQRGAIVPLVRRHPDRFLPLFRFASKYGLVVGLWGILWALAGIALSLADLLPRYRPQSDSVLGVGLSVVTFLMGLPLFLWTARSLRRTTEIGR